MMENLELRKAVLSWLVIFFPILAAAMGLGAVIQESILAALLSVTYAILFVGYVLLERSE